jgi:YHS domain-containing protein
MTRTAQFAIALSLLLLIAAGCKQSPRPQRPMLEVQTLESTGIRPAPVDPPPVLEEQTLPARRVPGQTTAKAAGENAEQQPSAEEALRARVNLPFTPSIAMDPVDGSKVSITKDTPIYSFENKWYYFSSEANRRTFQSNPESFATGRLASY